MNISQLKQLVQNNLWYGENSREQNRGFLLQEQGFISPDPNRILGIDNSDWNPMVDYVKMKAAGVKYVVLKAADGSLKSKYYDLNKGKVKAAGLPFDNYNWLYPNNKVLISAQVNTWVSIAKADPPRHVSIDFEPTKYGGVQANPTEADLKDATARFEDGYGESPIIYSAKYYTDQYLSATFPVNSFRWWLAHYGVAIPYMPKGLLIYFSHQFTSNLDAVKYGSDGSSLSFDGNYFNGTPEQFNAEYGIVVQPPPPSIFITHSFSDTVSLNGQEYTADFSVQNVEYKPKA